MKQGSLTANPVLVVGIVFALMTGIVLALDMPVTRITQVAIYALYGLGVNFLIGYLGLVPFGASFFFGVASYGVAISLRGALGNEIQALLFSAVFSLVLALALGAIILRRRGLYFSLLTLAASQIAFEIAYGWTSVTGGENGLQDVPRHLFPSAMAFHIFTVVVVVTLIFLLWRMVHAPFGRVMQAVRDNEQRMTSLGFNSFAIKLAAFSVSGVLIGVGGGLMALLLQGAYADNLSVQHAGDAVLMSALGGVHHFLGPLWGAITFIILEDQLSAITENWWLMFAPIIILFAVLSPEGMHGIARRWLKRGESWTLVRNQIPDKPAHIQPYVPASYEASDDSAEAPVLSVTGISKSFGSIVTSNNISLDIHGKQLHSLIGPNGAGKTTFFNMLTGVLPVDAGRIVFEGQDITKLSAYKRARLGLSRSFQILSVFPNLTTFENVRIAVQGSNRKWGAFWRDAYKNQDESARVWSLLETVGLTDRAGELCSALSHGEKRLLEIVLSLAGDARLLLLDEPLAGLGEADRQVVSKLIVRLSQHHAVLLIEHDIDRVLELSDRITVLHQGRLIADGTPDEVSTNPEVITAYMGEPRKTDDSADKPSSIKVVDNKAPVKAKPSGSPLLKLSDVTAGYGGGIVLDGLSFEVHRNEVLALLGRNGVGKTTALRTIMGAVEVSSGTITFDGKNITNARSDSINRSGISIVPEGRRLFPNLSVRDNLSVAVRPGGATDEEIFDLFPKLRVLARSKAENLSGGERQMVAVARALMAPSQLILLDEPFEGLSPAVVLDIRKAVQEISTKTAMIVVEHHADSVLSMADSACVLVNGVAAYSDTALGLANDAALQHRLLGVGQAAEEAA